MRLFSTFLTFLLLPLSGWSLSIMTDDGPAVEQRTQAVRRHGLDLASPPEKRVKDTPASVLTMFKELKGPAPTPHALTDAERLKVSAAFVALPPLHRRVLSERLRSVSFLDGMPNTALTSTVNPTEPYRLYDITIRAGILNESVSEWLTWKERSCFEAAGSSLSVTVEAGQLDALSYVLMHEATHVVDSCLGLTPATNPGSQPISGATPGTEFTQGVWSERVVHAPKFHEDHLDRVRFRAGGQIIPIDQAESVYRALGRTPFVSLYGSSNWYDDLAEYVAISHLTEKLKQPYRIVIRNKDVEVFLLEPMKSDIVRQRIDQMKRFYQDEG
jgi:hypothetical protein